ncbi:transposase family protein [Streptomyces erythrochromogenes]|uniref:transposase family protein n=1 Tax=Streptomyces erythrochromogenes TaxID=285574 RepID=UPI0036989AD9
MELETVKDALFPGLTLVVRQAVVLDDHLMIDAAGCGPPGACPACQHPAERVHSRYLRHIAGLPVNALRLLVRLRVRRFFCDQPRCPRRTSVEQVAGLTKPRRRSSTAARSAMRSVAVELGGRPGARLCAKLRLYGLRTSILGNARGAEIDELVLRLDEVELREEALADRAGVRDLREGHVLGHRRGHGSGR